MSVIINKNVNTTRHSNMKIMIERYDSAMQVVEDCKVREITDTAFDDIANERHIHDDWHGVNSYEEALDYLNNGYQPTVDRLKEKIKVSKVGEHKRVKFQNSIVGANPVVPLAIMGIPNCMVDTKIKPIKNKVIDVYYDITNSCGTDPEDIIQSGQKLLGAIIELENQGYAFNLYGVQSYSNQRSADILVVKVKSSGQPIDLKRISFPLTHVAFFRVIGFDWYSKCPKAEYRSGYGHAIGYELDNDETDEFADQVFGNNSIYIKGTEIRTMGDKYIKEVLTGARKV